MRIRRDIPLRPTTTTPAATTKSAKTPTSTTSTTTTTTTTPTTPTTPLPSTAQQAPKQAGQNGAPSWATPAFFQQLSEKVASSATPSTSMLPSGGKGLHVRLGAMTTKPTSSSTPTTPPPELKKKSATLIEQAARALAVVGGRPLTQAEIDGLGTAVHLTRKEAVAPILVQGLKPTTSVLGNWSTLMQRTVYMFPAPPKKGSIEDTVVRAQGMTEVIEVDLQKLDPSRLYKRVLDGAILYLTPEPLTSTALQHLGHIDDVMVHSRGPA